MSAIQQVMAAGGGDPYLSNVVWLSSFDTAIVDESPANKSLTVSGATVSTAEKKFGLASAKFDTTVKSIKLPAEQTFAGDFTIEMFVYANDTADRIVATGFAGNSQIFRINFGSTGKVFSYFNGESITSTNTPFTADAWHHLALVRISGVAYLYVDGVLEGSYSATNVTLYAIGTFIYGGDTTTTDVFNGYIDEVRVTVGVARYTTNFAVPTSAFPRS